MVAARLLEPRPHNLPQPLTGFVGREQEVAEIRRLLGETRLLTLTGSGGIGKTRLGHQVAASLVDPAPGSEQGLEDGIWLVELAVLADPALVPQAVAAALDVREEPEQPLTEALIDALRDARLLLVLDNCEHLIDACAQLADDLLRACPELRVLATSRQPLGIAGETTFRVPSLSLSGPAAVPKVWIVAEGERRETAAGALMLPAQFEPRRESEAVRLFVERARAAVPTFALTDRNFAAVEQICRSLDGIPLAIELAAARVAVLTPEQIAARLGDRFRLLSGGSRTALPRYRTLRALVDWSYDLLAERERVLFRRLAVFAGGWTLEAAESVCADEDLPADEILDLLSGLVAKSLVLTDEQTDEVRYRFLETLREYATAKLREAGEEAVLRGRHLRWLLALAERAEPELHGRYAAWWLDYLEGERDNLRAALAWCVERREVEAGLRLVSALSRLWQIRGPYREIRAVLAELLASPAGQQPAVPIQAARAKALLAAGTLALRQGDRSTAEMQCREALDISRELGDQHSLARALVSTGRVARVFGDYPAARSYDAEAIPVFKALGDDFWLARTYHHLGVAAFYEDDLATAREHFEVSLAIFKRLGDELGIVTLLEELGEVAFLQGDLETARSLLRTSLEMARRVGDNDRVAMALAALAGLAAAQRRPTRAGRLASAATALVEATERRNSPDWSALVERWLEPARRALSAEAWAAAQADGRAMPLDEAIEHALAPDESDTDEPACEATDGGAPTPRAPANAPASGGPALYVASPRWQAPTRLTRREHEVAALVARGLTNRQIADELVITEGTAANHVKHILARLVLDSRVQIATWAIEHGLHQRAAS
jgi:non-specific serine/threonine protein kinase